MTRRLRADLKGLTPYGAPQLDVPVRLNVNENPFPPSEDLIADIAREVSLAARSMNRYPDRDADQLRSDLAQFIARESHAAVDGSNIWAANGSNEIMLQIMQAFGGPRRKALAFTPSYSMYPDYCRDTFTEFVTEPTRADFSIDVDLLANALEKHQPDILILGSPNNPTGTGLPLDVLHYALRHAPGIVVVDEAYAEFRPDGTPSATTLISTNDHLVVTRTMSKAFSCAGLRLGYAVAQPELLAGLNIVRLPYHLSDITQAVARVALAHSSELLAQVNLLRNERDKLAIWLIDHGFTVVPSQANFLLFGHFGDRDAVWRKILEQGVLIRQTGPDGWLRVSIGTPEENEKFCAALLNATQES